MLHSISSTQRKVLYYNLFCQNIDEQIEVKHSHLDYSKHKKVLINLLPET